LILWRNRQTEDHLVLRSKPRNRRGDFEAQITKTVAAGFETQIGKPSQNLGFEAQSRNPPPVLRSNQEKPSQQVLRPNRQKLSQQFLSPKPPETVATGFEAKPEKIIPVVLSLNH
jgi:hypothetical protein